MVVMEDEGVAAVEAVRMPSMSVDRTGVLEEISMVDLNLSCGVLMEQSPVGEKVKVILNQ